MSQPPHEIGRQEYALLDAVRLGLTGDTRSLRQRARNLLRGGSGAVLSDAAREELRRLLTVEDELDPRRSSHSTTRLGPAAVTLEPRVVEDAETPALETTVQARVDQLIREHELRHLL